MSLPFKIEYEIAAVFIFAITIYYTYIGKSLPNIVNRIYKILVTVAFFTAILNLISVFTIAYSSKVPSGINYIINYCYLISQNSLTPIWFLYIYQMTKEEGRSWKEYLLYIPAVVVLMSFLITPAAGFIFYFNENNEYIRGNGMTLLYVCSFFYLLLSMRFTTYYRKKLMKNQRFAILLFLIITISAVFIQAMFPEFLITGFASAVSCLILYFSLQNPEERTDHTTGIFNRTALITTLNDFLKQEIRFDMVVLAIDQFKQINADHGFDAGDVFLRNIAKFLSRIVPDGVYRLDGDNLVLVFEPEIINTKQVIREIQRRFHSEWRVGDVNVNISTCICCICCPEDAGTVTEVLDTITKTIADAKELGEGTIIYASEHIENREKRISELEEQKKLLEMISREAEIARKEAEQADHAKSIFLANMSHEIRTPMNAILGMTELILREDVSDSIRDCIDSIYSAGRSLLSIINGILDISKIESGKLEIINDRYQMSSVIHDISNMICSKLTDKNVELILEIDKNIPDDLLGDELRLRQILLNLLGNAVKFTVNGYIRLVMKGERIGDSVILYIDVEDTGFGIKEEDLGQLFQTFSRVDMAKTRQIEGTGLGLAIAKQLLTLMKGEITVKSQYEKGTTFSIRLVQKIFNDHSFIEIKNREFIKPLVLLEEETKINPLMYILNNLEVKANFELESDTAWKTANTSKYTHIFISHIVYKTHKDTIDILLEQGTKIIVIMEFGEYFEGGNNLFAIQKPIYCLNVGEALNGVVPDKGKKDYTETFVAPEAKILIVDDNAVNLKVAEGLLKPYEMQITKALSGRECLALLESNQYHLVLLDHMMPEMDGIETIKRIRSQKASYYQNLKVIALTANAIRGVREMFIENGFDDYVSKPINTQRLEEVLLNHLPPKLMKEAFKETLAVQEDFPYEIPDVDTKAGIENCSGSVNMYWELLHMIVMEGYIKVDLMKEYIRTNNIRSYMVEAHALKSVAGSAGAKKLSVLAKEHEEEAKAENYSYIQKRGNELLNVYEQFLKSIEVVLTFRNEEDEEMEKKTISESEMKNQLETIYNCIMDYEDEEAMKKLKELRGTDISEYMKSRLKNTAEALQVLDYSRAAAIIKGELENM